MMMRLDFNPVTRVIYANTIKGKSQSYTFDFVK